MMPFLTTLLLVACLEVGQDPDASKLAEAAVADTTSTEAPSSTVPQVSFEIRDITVTTPDWRGKLLVQLEPIARQEGTAVWAIDGQGIADLLNHCQADARNKVVQAPRMTARLGEPVRMSSETAHHYVAHLKRVSDGPPNEGTHIAFAPEVDEVHSGIRVNLLSSHLKGKVLFARVVVEQNQLISFYTAKYSESVKPSPSEDPNVAKASLLGRLRPEHAANAATIAGTIQVPEVASRRIEGEWMIPSEGALLISMGANSRREKGSRQGYEERLIAISAYPDATATPETSPVETPAPIETPAIP